MRISILSAVLATLTTAAQATSVTLDDFSSSQTVVDVSASSSSQVADTSLLGGFRDLQAISDGAIVGGATGSISGGAFAFSTLAGQSGSVLLTYDGDDDALSVNTTGLGGFDLTEGGATAFALDVQGSGNPVLATVNLWDMIGGFSSFGDQISATGNFNLTFNSVIGDADLTNIGAVQFIFGGNGVEGQNISIASIAVSGPMSPIPLPASGLLLGAVLLGGVGAAARRRARG